MDPDETLKAMLNQRLLKLSASDPARLRRRAWELADGHHIVRFSRRHRDQQPSRYVEIVNDYYRQRSDLFDHAGVKGNSSGSWSSSTTHRIRPAWVGACSDLAQHVTAYAQSVRYR